ncbi:MAG TPA: hypothetical protein VNI52_13110 [Sphingobacteriaceae bacterium]|nr:hypothetical protein [Sphingobacteriaceae bacterium]
MLIRNDFKNLPSLDDFKRQLKALKQLDLENATLIEIEEAYLSHLPFLPRMLCYIHFNEARQQPLYRVRMNINPELEDLSLIRTYSYPSGSHCMRNGRANRRGKSVFYCSNKAFAAIYESKPTVGAIGYLSVWQNDITRPLKCAAYLPKRFDNSNEFQQIANNAHEFISNYFQENGKDKFEHFMALNDFIVEQGSVK